MRLTYIVQYFTTPDQRGAGKLSYIGHTRAYENARRLVRKGHSVTVLTAELTSGTRGLWTSEEIEGISVQKVAVPYDQAMSYRRRALAFAEFTWLATTKAIREPSDVVLASSPPLTVAIPSMATARKNEPMVLEVRDLWPDMPISMGLLGNPAVRAGARALELASYRRSRRIVVLSQGMADELIARGFPAEKIDVVTNACDLDLFSGTGDPERFFELVPGVRNRPFALFAGTMGPLHNLGWVLDLCANMLTIDERPAIVLQGYGAQREALIEEASTRGLLDRNLFFGPQVPKVRIADSYRAARLGLSVATDAPGIENNSANKFFDSLAAGRGMAVNYGGWQGDVLTQTGAGVALPRDPSAAARQVTEILLDAARCEEMGRMAGVVARDRFSRDSIASQLESSLLRAIG